MPVYSYTVSDATPYTKIASADWNSRFNNVKTWINWDGSGTTSGLNDSNIQSNSVSGGGLTRSSKLKSGTANYAVYNDGSGNMTEASALPALSGGTGNSVVPGNQQAGDVLQINAALTAWTVGPPTAVAASLRLYQFSYLG